MNPLQITDYMMEWNATSHTGQVEIWLSDQTTKIITLAADEWGAVAMLLSKTPVYYDTTSGMVTTEKRATGS